MMPPLNLVMATHCLLSLSHTSSASVLFCLTQAGLMHSNKVEHWNRIAIELPLIPIFELIPWQTFA